MKKRDLTIYIVLCFGLAALALLLTEYPFGPSPQNKKDRILKESRLDANLIIKEGEIVLAYSNGQTDTLRGEGISKFIKDNPRLSGSKASVYKVDMLIEKKTCVVHSVFIYDRERTSFTAVSCN